MAAERFAERDDQDASTTLLAFGDQVQGAIDELREVAHGIYPPLLASDGLGPALAAAARRSAYPVTVSADGVDRYPPEIESAVYFSVLAALDNAAKYAGRGPVTVKVWAANERLRRRPRVPRQRLTHRRGLGEHARPDRRSRRDPEGAIEPI
jgi:signal transduction histidine kinase